MVIFRFPKMETTNFILALMMEQKYQLMDNKLPVFGGLEDTNREMVQSICKKVNTRFMFNTINKVDHINLPFILRDQE